jgi:hypothetical protein
MSSNINYNDINEQFPVAGEDNDTQTLRDNFDTIKDSLRIAKEEITLLQNISPRLDQENDFNGQLVRSAVFENCSESVLVNNVETEIYTVEYDTGNYHILTVLQDALINFDKFPLDTLGKITLELYCDSGSRTVTFGTSGSNIIKKSSNFPESVILDSTDNPVIIEIWKHGSNKVFLNYLGKFS